MEQKEPKHTRSFNEQSKILRESYEVGADEIRKKSMDSLESFKEKYESILQEFTSSAKAPEKVIFHQKNLSTPSDSPEKAQQIKDLIQKAESDIQKYGRDALLKLDGIQKEITTKNEKPSRPENANEGSSLHSESNQ